MALNSVWVYADIAAGKPLTLTLELLTKARGLGAGEVAVVYAGANASEIAAALGEYGAAKVYATGDLGEHLPGPSVAGAIAASIEAGTTPDLILFGQQYKRRNLT